MPRSLKELARAVQRRQLVRIERAPIDTVPLDGFALGLSDRYLLVQHVEQTVQLNGYMVVRLEDISSWQHHPFRDFVQQALGGRREEMQPLDKFPLEDLGQVLNAVKVRAPLVAIHTEKVDSHRCWIGKIASVTEHSLFLRKISAMAQWIEMERFRLRDITRIDWGGLYEQALWEVNASAPPSVPRTSTSGPIHINGKVSIDPHAFY